MRDAAGVSTKPQQVTSPRIAIVIPCFNDGATVGETVDSALQQESCEIVVIDDGSTDPHTQQVCAALAARGDVTVVRQENRGLSAARMAGVEATSAPYVYPIDSDDRITPYSLSALADALDRSPDNVAASWGTASSFGKVKVVYKQVASTIDPWRITHSAGISYSAMYRREALMSVGGWSLRGPYEDWDLWMALAEQGYGGMHVPVRTLCYRVHSGERMWAKALKRHDEILKELRTRHTDLFANRKETWRASREPLRVRLIFPAIGLAPLPPTIRQRAYMAVEDPRRTIKLAALRFARR